MGKVLLYMQQLFYTGLCGSQKKKQQVSKSHMTLRHMLFSFCCHLTHYATIAAYLYAAKSFSKCIDECEQIGTITSIRVFRRYLSNFIFSSN